MRPGYSNAVHKAYDSIAIGLTAVVREPLASRKPYTSTSLREGMEEVSTIEERVNFLTETYDLSKRNAQALYLAEMGYSHSGIARALDVGTSTAKTYLRRLEKRIGEGVTESLPKSQRFATYPGDTPKSEVRYSGNHVEISDELEDRDVSLNRGCKLSDIPNELITV